MNVVWGWLGTAASFIMGFFVSPLLIQRLGEQNYGLWAIALAFIDYFNIFDFGFKSATVQLLARFRAQNNPQAMNVAFNTAFVYFLSVGLVLFTASWLAAPSLASFLRISPALRPDFVLLVRIIAVGWTLAFTLTGVVAAAEAFQLFKVQNNIHILTQILRAGGYVWVLFSGFGLPVLGTVTTLTQFFNYGMILVFLLRSHPELRFSPFLFDRAIWKELRSFGGYAFISGIGTFLLNQGPGFVVGRSVSEAAIGYFSLPNRILQYVVELVTRIGSVTMPNATALASTGRYAELASLATYINRYCFALFLPLAIFLLFYGPNVLAAWVSASFAAQAAPLLTPFLLSTSLAVAAQFNSISILFGMARHAPYSRLVIVEAVVMLSSMALVIPHYGLPGAAWALAIAAILSRGICTPLILCSTLSIPVLPFLNTIYTLPLLLALPVSGLLYWLHSGLIPGSSWFELALAAAISAISYYILFLSFGLQPSHRNLLMASVRRWLPAPLSN